MFDEKMWNVPDNPVALHRIATVLDDTYGVNERHLTDLAPRIYRKIYLGKCLGLERRHYEVGEQETINIMWMWYSGGGVAALAYKRILDVLELNFEDDDATN